MSEQKFHKMSDLMLSNYKDLEKYYSGDVKAEGLVTGLDELDRLIGGLKRGSLIVVSGRPDMGKTSFLITLTRNVGASRKESKSVAFFSMREEAEDLSMSLLSCDSKVSLRKMMRGKFKADDWRKLAEASGHLAESKIFISSNETITAGEIKNACSKLLAETSLDLVVIDDLDRMQSYGESSFGHNRGTVLETMKSMAKELDIPVVISLSLKEFSDDRKDFRPVVSDLPGASLVEAYADTIMFLYREEIYNKIPEADGLAEVIVARQRNGWGGTVRSNFDAETRCFFIPFNERSYLDDLDMD